MGFYRISVNWREEVKERMVGEKVGGDWNDSIGISSRGVCFLRKEEENKSRKKRSCKNRREEKENDFLFKSDR